MLIGLILTLLFVFSSVFAPIMGNSSNLGQALAEGSAEALRFSLSIGGSICLWSGMLELMERCGLAERLSLALRPLLGRIFPGALKDRELMAALSENLSANMLGLGNAATPAGVRAARAMARGSGGTASDELCRLMVLNTASVQLLPVTIASLRSVAGAEAAFDIVPAVWISSLISLSCGFLAAALLRRLWK